MLSFIHLLPSTSELGHTNVRNASQIVDILRTIVSNVSTIVDNLHTTCMGPGPCGLCTT